MRAFAKFGSHARRGKRRYLQCFPRLEWKRNFIFVWLSYDFITLRKNFDGHIVILSFSTIADFWKIVNFCLTCNFFFLITSIRLAVILLVIQSHLP